MKIKPFTMAAALAMAMPLAAIAGPCTSTFSLGTLGPGGFATLANGFTSATAFDDCYNFSLSAVSNAVGITMEWNLFDTALAADITSITLSGGSLPSTASDTTPESFTFSGLGAGSYQLTVHGNASGAGRGLVGYWGTLAATPGNATPVPEPALLAMFTLGLAGLAWGARRKT